ncbi:pyridoxamine 5'-phosphate oxidase family protein [Streptosporangium longisporum]
MREPVAERNLDGYGAPPIPWKQVLEGLDDGFSQVPGSGGPGRYTCWLTTVCPDGRPHVMPLGALWWEGAFHFTTGPGTRKGRNLAHDPRCAVTVALKEFDLVVEGRAERVTGDDRLHGIAAAYAAQGWEPSVRDGALYAEYSAPSAGPPPWYVYEVVPDKVFALGTAAPYGATRWNF